MSMFTLAISCLTTSNLPNTPGSYAISFFTASDFTFTTRHIHNWALFPLWPNCFILFGAISDCPPLFPGNILDNFWPQRAHLPVSYLFAVSYCSWGSRSKTIGVGGHFLVQWTTFCQNSPLWPVHLGCPCRAWFIALSSYASPFAMTRMWSMKG